MAVVRYVGFGLIEFTDGLQLRIISEVEFVSTICVNEVVEAYLIYVRSLD